MSFVLANFFAVTDLGVTRACSTGLLPIFWKPGQGLFVDPDRNRGPKRIADIRWPTPIVRAINI